MGDYEKKMGIHDKIELTNITYAYPNTDKKIFDHANMTIPYGKSVGIMGTSGAGKSTAVDIILGLLHVQEGNITCDGKDIFESYASWLAQIGYIPQTIYLIDESIRENIGFGIKAEDIDEERVWETHLGNFGRGPAERFCGIAAGRAGYESRRKRGKAVRRTAPKDRYRQGIVPQSGDTCV